MIEIEIRIGITKDAKEIQKIRKITWAATYPNKKLGVTRKAILFRDFYSPQKIKRIKAHLRRHSERTWIVIYKKKLIGFCTAEKGKIRNRLSSLYLLPRYQGRGIGKALMRYALEWLGAQKAIFLTVVPYNKKAISFYKQYGFKKGRLLHHEIPILPNGKDIPEMEMILKQKRDS